MKLFCSILFQFLFPMKMLPNDIHHAEKQQRQLSSNYFILFVSLRSSNTSPMQKIGFKLLAKNQFNFFLPGFPQFRDNAYDVPSDPELHIQHL